jgi:hypothetical protein
MENSKFLSLPFFSSSAHHHLAHRFHRMSVLGCAHFCHAMHAIFFLKAEIFKSKCQGEVHVIGPPLQAAL